MGIKSIWDNPFYSNKKTPIPKWSFEVVFDTYKDDARTLNQAIISVQFGRREISTVSTYYAGVESKHPGRIQNPGELNIQFNENSDMEVSNILTKAFSEDSFNDAYFEGGSYSSSSPKTEDHNIRVRLIKPSVNMEIGSNDASQYAKTYIFHNCFIIGINEEEISYENEDDIITRTAKFSYDYMTEE